MPDGNILCHFTSGSSCILFSFCNLSLFWTDLCSSFPWRNFKFYAGCLFSHYPAPSSPHCFSSFLPIPQFSFIAAQIYVFFLISYHQLQIVNLDVYKGEKSHLIPYIYALYKCSKKPPCSAKVFIRYVESIHVTLKQNIWT